MWWRLRKWPGQWLQLFLSEQERWAYWLPVFLGLGIASYYALPVEPSLILTLIAPALCLLGLIALRQRPYAVMGVIVVLAFCLGLGAASVRTAWVAQPMLSRKLGPVEVTATIIERELREEGARLLLSDITIERLPATQTPLYVRLTLRGQGALPGVGARIKVLANLLPPMEPAYPGGYDFRRDAYYAGIGAYGMALRAPEILESANRASLAERWREQLSEYIQQKMPGAEGAIAVALMTGERSAIDDVTNANMRAAGTQHLLSISGMHIGMVGGFVFFVLRALLALSPYMALHYPIKRWAAGAAMGVVIAYTWLVGAPIPAQRAALMASLVFLAIMLDRQALSMRSVALAAGVILLLFPESLLNPGFQMSFAAIVMLIAAYEWWKQKASKNAQANWISRALRYLVGIVVTSLVAGFATMPYSVWHFHRVQLLGVIGNLIAVPLTGVVIMPAVVISYLLVPLGLAAPALAVLQMGLVGVTQSAAWVAAMPFASLNAGQIGPASVACLTLGGLWLALWQTRLRYAALVPISIGFMLTFYQPQPLALVSAEGQIAVRGADGGLYAQRAQPRGKTYEQWELAYNAGGRLQSWRSTQSGFICDAVGCVRSDIGLALPQSLLALAADCTLAHIIIAPELRIKPCAAPLVIDRIALRMYGAAMIWPDGGLTSNRIGAQRPWQPGYGDSPAHAEARRGSMRRDYSRSSVEAQALSDEADKNPVAAVINDTSGSDQPDAPEP